MPRFVVLEHDHPALHWDLMFQVGEVLHTWRLAAPPRVGETIAAERTFDHRLLYLDYEGPVSNNRGRVIRHDSGDYEWLERTPDLLVAEMRGRCVVGELRLVRVQGEECWAMTLSGDRSGRSSPLTARPPE